MTNPQNDRTGALEVPPMSSEEAAHIVQNDDARTSDTAHTGETQDD